MDQDLPSMKPLRALIRKVVTVVAVLVAAMNSSAQKSPELDYLIRFSSAITPVQEKYIFEALQGHEPDLGVWVDGHNAEVKVRTHVRIDRAALEAQLSPQGLYITLLVQLNGGQAIERSAEGGTARDLPQFIDTGNPGSDNADYEAAKAAWIAAHQGEYESTTAPADPE